MEISPPRRSQPAPVELPIACSLDGERLAARRDRWSRVAESALRSRESTPSGVRLTFDHGRAVEAELAELVELERDCCRFAAWKLTGGEGCLILEVSAAGEAVPVIQAMFDLEEGTSR